MDSKKTKRKVNNKGITLFLVALTAAIILNSVFAAVPSGPAIQYISNETSSTSGSPTIEDQADSEGGTIITLILTARQQNSHYKAYVGNVTGAYVLEDASNYSIYEWSVSTVGGQVYATRTGNAITWTNVECANITHIENEMSEMHHNSTNTPDDGMNDTFDDDGNDHWGFWAGGSQISSDSCNYSINTFVNDSTQVATEWFDQVVLYDGSGDIIYVSKVENDIVGYHTNSTYDFQMLVAENGSPSNVQTDYYFYVELS